MPHPTSTSTATIHTSLTGSSSPSEVYLTRNQILEGAYEQLEYLSNTSLESFANYTDDQVRSIPGEADRRVGGVDDLRRFRLYVFEATKTLKTFYLSRNERRDDKANVMLCLIHTLHMNGVNFGIEQSDMVHAYFGLLHDLISILKDFTELYRDEDDRYVTALNATCGYLVRAEDELARCLHGLQSSLDHESLVDPEFMNSLSL